MHVPGTIDSHVHFWDPGRLDYSWLAGEPDLSRRFTPDDLDTGGVALEGLVFVQADCRAEQAAEAGLRINARTVSDAEYWTPISSGDFQLALYGLTQSLVADPFSNYDQYFSGQSTAPVGEDPVSGQNYARYQNADVDAAVAVAAGTLDETIKKDAYAKIQAQIAEDLPYIPVVLNASQAFFNVDRFTGWPTEGDLYANPLPYLSAASAIVLTHLKPAE